MGISQNPKTEHALSSRVADTFFKVRSLWQVLLQTSKDNNVKVLKRTALNSCALFRLTSSRTRHLFSNFEMRYNNRPKQFPFTTIKDPKITRGREMVEKKTSRLLPSEQNHQFYRQSLFSNSGK